MKFLVNPERTLKKTGKQGEIPPTDFILKRMIRIAWPSVTESFLVALVGMIDTMMVGELGAAAIAAVGLTTQPKFVGLAFFMSLSVAVSAIVARRKGEQDAESANNVLRVAIVITVVMTAIISTFCLIFADPILRMAGSSEDTHALAVSYFRIIMGGMFFNVLAITINAAQRGVGNTKIAMRTNLVSNLINIVLNYLLIGGKCGFPKLGVAGAAIATVCGTVVACGMSVFSVLHRGDFLCLITKERLRFDKRSIRSLVDVGSSTLVEQVFIRFGFFLYALIVAKLGTAAFAAHQIGINLMSLSFSLGDGLSVAAVTLVGQSLGEKREDMALIYGSTCQRVGFLFSCLLGVVFLSGHHLFFRLFTDDPSVLRYSTMLMAMITAILFLQISQTVFSGCLRGAGDTRYVALVSLISIATVRPFLGWLFCYPLAWGLFGAWLGLAVDQMVRFAMNCLRFRSGKWTKIKI